MDFINRVAGRVDMDHSQVGYEPRQDYRRPFGKSYAAIGASSSVASYLSWASQAVCCQWVPEVASC
jgi:hypothetical protein